MPEYTTFILIFASVLLLTNKIKYSQYHWLLFTTAISGISLWFCCCVFFPILQVQFCMCLRTGLFCILSAQWGPRPWHMFAEIFQTVTPNVTQSYTALKLRFAREVPMSHNHTLFTKGEGNNCITEFDLSYRHAFSYVRHCKSHFFKKKLFKNKYSEF